MAIRGELTGKRVRLRCADIKDAQFTLEIRNDENLTKYIPRLGGNVEQQENWLAKQREKKGDYFFIIETLAGEARGTLSFYDVDDSAGVCELGRFISYGNALENVEAVILLLDCIYNEYHLNVVILNNDQQNKKIISFWKKFGAAFDSYVEFDGWTAAQYRLTKENYEMKRQSIASLL